MCLIELHHPLGGRRSRHKSSNRLLKNSYGDDALLTYGVAQLLRRLLLRVERGSTFSLTIPNAKKGVHLGSPWNAALTFKKKYRSSRKP